MPAGLAQKCAGAFGIAFWTVDYRELVSRDDVDAVCVFSPDHLHAEHCIGALENGKHVVCTKPMVTSLEDAKKLVGLVRQKKTKFLVGQTMRFDRQFSVAQRLFNDGDLGSLIALESHYVHDMRPVFEQSTMEKDSPSGFDVRRLRSFN